MSFQNSGAKQEIGMKKKVAHQNCIHIKRPILNGRGNRKIKEEVTSIKVTRHVANVVELQENT